MDQNQPEVPQKEPPRERSLPIALLSGAVFAALGAAAASWLAAHTIRRAPREKPGFGANWITWAGGVFSGTVAFFSAYRNDNTTTPSAVPEKPQALAEPVPAAAVNKTALPGVQVLADAAEREGMLAHQQQNLGL